MTDDLTTIDISTATDATDEVVEAFTRLLPQLSASARPLDRQALAEIVGASCNAVLLARDRADGGRIVGALTLVIFRIPTAVRAWICCLPVRYACRPTHPAARISAAAGMNHPVATPRLALK